MKYVFKLVLREFMLDTENRESKLVITVASKCRQDRNDAIA